VIDLPNLAWEEKTYQGKKIAIVPSLNLQLLLLATISMATIEQDQFKNFIKLNSFYMAKDIIASQISH